MARSSVWTGEVKLFLDFLAHEGFDPLLRHPRHSVHPWVPLVRLLQGKVELRGSPRPGGGRVSRVKLVSRQHQDHLAVRGLHYDREPGGQVPAGRPEAASGAEGREGGGAAYPGQLVDLQEEQEVQSEGR